MATRTVPHNAADHNPDPRTVIDNRRNPLTAAIHTVTGTHTPTYRSRQKVTVDEDGEMVVLGTEHSIVCSCGYVGPWASAEHYARASFDLEHGRAHQVKHPQDDDHGIPFDLSDLVDDLTPECDADRPF